MTGVSILRQSFQKIKNFKICDEKSSRFCDARSRAVVDERGNFESGDLKIGKIETARICRIECWSARSRP